MMMQVLFLLFSVANWFGKAELIADSVMTLDKACMVNDLIPFKNEKEKMIYDQRYDDALSSLKSQITPSN